MQGYQILEAKLLPLRKFLRKNSINEKEVEVIKNFLKEVEMISGLVYRQKIEKFQRVTVNSWIEGVDDRIDYVKHLKNPPVEYVKKYGRANVVEQSVLYATFDYLTALSEMRPKVGDKITVSFWKLNTDYDLCVTPIFKRMVRGEVQNELSLRAQIQVYNILNKYELNIRKQIEIILDFIADTFSKEIQDGNHFDYYLSSHYANRLFNEFENGEVDAILYPSVRQSLAFSNIALKPEVFNEHYVLEKVEESIITSRPILGYNGWTMDGTGYSQDFENGKIIW